jgi:transcriptional regulator with GAF, ATPase, and Fis domain
MLTDAGGEHILESWMQILETWMQTDWLVGGQDGAANRLGLPRTTLVYKMRKLGIETRRPRWRAPLGG